MTAQQREDDCSTTRNLGQGKAFEPNAPSGREAEGHGQQLIATQENTTQGFRAQMLNSNEVTQRCPQSYASLN